ncbi:MAG: glutathione synthase [Candidatus Fonsibacter lacus]|jgi:glutathione synthase|nr:glutathione synthase [Candidatus Fonsibacter lacus]NCU48909.1 glutathione synthase [Candidatus Fonsibacter lacus]NDC43762.1 glutathione synthase [Pseudomonadota bacterium]
MKKHFKIAIQMDPLESINIKSDSTYILALEAQKRGYRLFHYLPENLIYENGRVSALGNVFKLFPNKKIFFKKYQTQKIFLDDYDVILVRQDPPFNMSYITATYLLEKVSNKTLILNNPKSIRDNPEKLSMFNFKSVIPPTLISKNIEQCFNFQKKYKKTIIKPLYGNGGEGISKLEGINVVLKRKILKLINKYKQPIVMQKYLSEIKEGDRRIILMDGEYVGSVARIPKKGSVTANFHTGGTAKKVGLIRRDKKICNILKPFLKKNKLFFTGIDIIGNYLTEINVTSPTGIQEINRLNGARLEKFFWDRVEKKLR